MDRPHVIAAVSRKHPYWLLGAAFLLLLACWELLASTPFWDRSEWASPSAIMRVLAVDLVRTPETYADQNTSKTLSEHILHSLFRFLCGFGLAAVLGIAAGFALGVSRTAHTFGYPIANLLRGLPSASIWPVCALIVGYGLGSQLVVIVFGAIWPVLINTANGVRLLPQEVYDTLRFQRQSPWQRRLALLRWAAPGVLTGIELACAVAFLLTVTVEIFWPARGGLGWYLYYHQEQHEQAQVLGGVLVTAFLGWALNSGVHALKGRLIRWDLRSGDRKLTEPPGATRPVSRTALMALPQPLKDLLTTSRVSETLQQQMGVPIRPTILHQGRPYMVPRDVIQFFGPYLKSGQVIQRDVLVQDPAGEPVLFARSWAHLGAFSERSRNDLQSQQQTLGQILRGNHEPCSYRDLRLREVTSQRLWLLFRKQGSPKLFQRERLIYVAGRPAALIHEFVPLP